MKWLNEPHVQEFWDNTQAHKEDILNFIQGRKTPSQYAEGNGCFSGRKTHFLVKTMENS